MGASYTCKRNQLLHSHQGAAWLSPGCLFGLISSLCSVNLPNVYTPSHLWASESTGPSALVSFLSFVTVSFPILSRMRDPAQERLWTPYLGWMPAHFAPSYFLSCSLLISLMVLFNILMACPSLTPCGLSAPWGRGDMLVDDLYILPFCCHLFSIWGDEGCGEIQGLRKISLETFWIFFFLTTNLTSSQSRENSHDLLVLLLEFEREEVRERMYVLIGA